MTTALDESTLRTDAGPNLKAMQAELTRACDNAVDRMEDLSRDENVRFARWNGQRDDGRLPDLVDGRPAEPWPRASDTRVHLADSIVVDQVALMKAAERKARLTVRGTESGDFGPAGKVQLYLDHLRNTRLRSKVAAEAEIAANWRQTHGRAVMAVTWHQEWAREYETVELSMLAEASEADPAGPAALLLASLYEPDKDVRKAAAVLLTQLYPDLDRGEAHRQLDALRKTGAMEVPVRYTRLNEPQWTALKPWRDVFFPLNTEDAQNARWIAWRRVFNRAQVEEKAISELWPEDFVAAVLKTVSATVLDTSAAAGANRQVFRDTEEEMEGLYEVFYFYYTHTDETGVPCKYRTVMSPHVKAEGGEIPHGPDEPLGYKHGLYPFVFMRRERPDRMMEETRGVAEIAATAQMEVKSLRDARVNQTELYLQPPTIRPEREVGLPLKIRPRGEIGERRAQATRQWEVRNTAQAAEPVENAARRDVDQYFARDRVENPARASLHDQALADDWCGELQECWAMTLQLSQQFELEAVFTRIVGGKPKPFTVTREEIQGRYDIQLYFNTDTLDPERMKAKISLVKDILQPMDRWGVLNFAPALSGIAAYLFPEYADQMVQDVEQASEREVKDEQSNWALIMAGEEPQMAEAGQNFQLRLEWLKNKLAQPSAQARLQNLPDSAELVMRRMQHLEFQLQQRDNADTGRVGVPPLPPEGAGAGPQ